MYTHCSITLPHDHVETTTIPQHVHPLQYAPALSPTTTCTFGIPVIPWWMLTWQFQHHTKDLWHCPKFEFQQCGSLILWRWSLVITLKNDIYFLFTGFAYVQNQRSKHSFEREASMCGVTKAPYWGNNGWVYHMHEFQRNLHALEFSSVGTHHQNGNTKRAIKTITESARSILLHAAIHWLEQVSLNLCPFAVDYAVYLWNITMARQWSLQPSCACGVKVDVTITQISTIKNISKNMKA